MLQNIHHGSGESIEKILPKWFRLHFEVKNLLDSYFLKFDKI